MLTYVKHSFGTYQYCQTRGELWKPNNISFKLAFEFVFDESSKLTAS